MIALLSVVKILVVLPVIASAVKIGVSKVNTTTATTLVPNTFVNDPDTTTTLAPLTTTLSDIENSISATVVNDTSKLRPQFPPKISHPTTSITTTSTPVPIATTPKEAANVTASNSSSTMNPPLLDDTDRTLTGSTNFYCSCDLLAWTCDVNCCCDRDCAKEALKVFECFSPSKYPQPRSILEEFQYEHGLPSCKVNDGWLCVFRTNTNPPKKKLHLFDFNTKNKYKWAESLMELTENALSKEQDFYKFGDQLKTLNMDTLEVHNFEIPYAHKPPFCQLRDSIRHLSSTSRNCLAKSLTTAQEVKRKFLDFIASSKLLSQPRNQVTDSDDLKDLVRDFKLNTCTQLSGTTDFTCKDLDVLYNETESNEFENYYVSEFRIKIMHNFTDLIACHIELKEQEATSNEDPLELWQKFDVEFVSSNESELSKKHMLLSFSGPLGYLQGKPVIVSTFTAYNESEELSPQNRVLDYFKNPNVVNNTLGLLSQRSGLCHKNYGQDFSINYGVSSLTQCTLRIAKESLFKGTNHSPKKTNFTETCVRLQQQILEMLFNEHATQQLNDLTDLHISIFGHPQNSSDKWLRLHVQNLEFAPISGQLISKSQTLLCQNILLNAAYDIHVGSFTENGIARQALVKNAVLKLGPRHDLEFALDERLEVPLTLTVMFYDLSINIGTPMVRCINGVIFVVFIIFSCRIINFTA